MILTLVTRCGCQRTEQWPDGHGTPERIVVLLTAEGVMHGAAFQAWPADNPDPDVDNLLASGAPARVFLRDPQRPTLYREQPWIRYALEPMGTPIPTPSQEQVEDAMRKSGLL